MPDTRENGMHGLRHYFASVLLEGGVSIRAVAAYLGHPDPGFTLRTYTHLMPTAEDRVREAIETAFEDPPSPARTTHEKDSPSQSWGLSGPA